VYSSQPQGIVFEQPEAVKKIINEYHDHGKPIGLAVGCQLGNMESNITSFYGSTVQPKENWIALDIKNAHIWMDVTDKAHWQQLSQYLKEHKVEIQTVALTGMKPDISSPILNDSILPLMQKGGLIVYPECFQLTDCFNQQHGLYSKKYGGNWEKGISSYHNHKSLSYHNKEALIQETVGWIDQARGTFGWGFYADVMPTPAAKRLEAKFFVSQISALKSAMLTDGEFDYSKWAGYITDGEFDFNKWKKNIEMPCYSAPFILYTKKPNEFYEEYFIFFKEFMSESGYSSSIYKIYADPDNVVNGIEPYTYPKDGAFKLTGLRGEPSLVLFKQ
jgi:hypothetical protein